MSKRDEKKTLPRYETNGFFGFRTPLLPFATYTAWQDDVVADDYGSTVDAVRCLLRKQLDDSAVAEAIYVASRNLHAAIDSWREDPESESGRKVERSLMRYFARMCSRATPFGLFAGHGVGAIDKSGQEAALRLRPRSDFRRQTRPDYDFLIKVGAAVSSDCQLRTEMPLSLNTSVYAVPGGFRYYEAQLVDGTLTYHLSYVESSEFLDSVAQVAQSGSTMAELSAAVVAADEDGEVTSDEAEAFVHDLIDEQFLIMPAAPVVSGADPLSEMREQLQPYASAQTFTAGLGAIREALSTLDEGGLGQSALSYVALHQKAEALVGDVDPKRLMQVDLVVPAEQATMTPLLRDELQKALDVVSRLSTRELGPLGDFEDSFRRRFEGRTIPLTTALDPESGILLGTGTQTVPEPPGDTIPVGDAPASETALTLSASELALWRKLSKLPPDADEFVLGDEDIEDLCASEATPLAKAVSSIVTLAASSREAVQAGDFELVEPKFVGPSGARLIGRFCLADEALLACTRDHIAAEEALDPEALFAEIVHLPGGRNGNVLARPNLRRYEIPFLGRTTAPTDAQIPVTDLYLSIQNGLPVLWSKHHNRRVIPRMSNAQAWSSGSFGIYAFLCWLQAREGGGAIWNWGGIESLRSYLPRLRCGRVVLARARWRVAKEEIERLSRKKGEAAFNTAKAWQSERHMPRFVLFPDNDVEFLVDFENPLSIEAFVHAVPVGSSATLIELYPTPDRLWVEGPEGRYVHQLVVPMTREPEEHPIRPPPPVPAGLQVTAPFIEDSLDLTARGAIRAYPPGSEWLYLKIFGGRKSVEQVLCETLAPELHTLLEEGHVDRWFFIRYRDPDWQIRLRLHGQPQALLSTAMSRIAAALKEPLSQGKIHLVQLDTYETEFERYGGASAMELAERVFFADSIAVLAILRELDDEAGDDARWRLCLRGCDMLLNDFGFDLEAKHALLERLRILFGKEFRAGVPTLKALGARFRDERKALTALLQPANDAGSPLLAGLRHLHERSVALADIVASYGELVSSGRLQRDIGDVAVDFLHMHINRFFSGNARKQELVLYDFLCRLYESQLARERGRGRKTKPA